MHNQISMAKVANDPFLSLSNQIVAAPHRRLFSNVDELYNISSNNSKLQDRRGLEDDANQLFNTSVHGVQDGRKLVNNDHAEPVISSSMADGDSFEGTTLLDAMRNAD